MTRLSFFFILIPLLSVILMSVTFVLAPHLPYKEKDSPFECGYHSFLQTRSPFIISFVIFAWLFMILDLEIVFIFPFGASSYSLGIYSLANVVIFISILTLGFAFEIGKKALTIFNKNMGKNLNMPKLSSKIKVSALFAIFFIITFVAMFALYTDTYTLLIDVFALVNAMNILLYNVCYYYLVGMYISSIEIGMSLNNIFNNYLANISTLYVTYFEDISINDAISNITDIKSWADTVIYDCNDYLPFNTIVDNYNLFIENDNLFMENYNLFMESNNNEGLIHSSMDNGQGNTGGGGDNPSPDIDMERSPSPPSPDPSYAVDEALKEVKHHVANIHHALDREETEYVVETSIDENGRLGIPDGFPNKAEIEENEQEFRETLDTSLAKENGVLIEEGVQETLAKHKESPDYPSKKEELEQHVADYRNHMREYQNEVAKLENKTNPTSNGGSNGGVDADGDTNMD